MTTTTMTITVTTPFTEHDLDYLRALIGELSQSGRDDEAETLARVHALLQPAVAASLYGEDNTDPELEAALAEAEADFAAGRWTAHEEMVRRLRALHDA